MKKHLILITSIITLLFLFTACESTGKYQSQTGIDKVNPAYTGKGGEAKEIVAKGISQITSAGEQDAFNRALEHAQRQAIEKTLGAMVRSETLVENSTLIEDKIYSKSSGFIQKYKILSDMRDGQTKVVEIRAWVVMGDVKEDAMALGLLQDRVGRPSVLVLMKEKSMDGQKTDHAKNYIHQALTAKEFKFVDEAQLKKVLAARNIQVSKITGVSDSILAKVAIDAGAQIIIKGTVNSAKQNISGIPANWTSIRTTINASAIYAGDATIIATSSDTKPAALLDPNSAQVASIKKAGKGLCEDLIDKIIKKWDDMVNNGFEYTITISGVDFTESGDVKSAISKKIEGVKKVFEKSYNNNTLTLLVRYSGVSTDLARMLVAKGKMPVPLQVKNVNSKSILVYKPK